MNAWRVLSLFFGFTKTEEPIIGPEPKTERRRPKPTARAPKPDTSQSYFPRIPEVVTLSWLAREIYPLVLEAKRGKRTPQERTFFLGVGGAIRRRMTLNQKDLSSAMALKAIFTGLYCLNLGIKEENAPLRDEKWGLQVMAIMLFTSDRSTHSFVTLRITEYHGQECYELKATLAGVPFVSHLPTRIFDREAAPEERTLMRLALR